MNYQAPRGTYDILPSDITKWHYLEAIINDVTNQFNYKEIRTPIFESSDLFTRSVGETTDIVSKEMYNFEDKKGRNMTLRPEGTAGVVRAYVQNKLYADANTLSKLYYVGPMFRYERAQKGRQRQFTQFGVEAIGSLNPAVDAEVIALAVEIIKRLGLKEIKVAINSLGDTDSRVQFREALINHFKGEIDSFCSDCQKRIESNPLRILDCKKDRSHPLMVSAPKTIDFLNEESKQFFDTVINYLDALNIDYIVDTNLVRGLDYYNHTVFEVMSNVKGFGAQTTLVGGGRYNGLVQDIGGPDQPGIGFAFGMERLILAMEAEDVEIQNNDDIDIYVVALGDVAHDYAFTLQHKLRENGIKVEKDYFSRKIKSQFKQADKLNATYTVVIGDDEIKNDQFTIKNMKTGNQKEISSNGIINYIKSNL
ncbi:histidine--tRNA ligase [Haloplasma contractile]|uniref:Histidine--tRNA ligase n=1 Tax=Haloplasma contractile SSD-17B TaxID=1033810 RepID=F7PVX6_9MOLU|nr:histidine--tRNA ligase [Haloplasma contractile]ERJ12700.1 Histidine--tRNA ligase protein [Haloplasma contractile SSD-17B]